jgi:hypothetical protein
LKSQSSILSGAEHENDGTPLVLSNSLGHAKPDDIGLGMIILSETNLVKGGTSGRKSIRNSANPGDTGVMNGGPCGHDISTGVSRSSR